MAAVVQISDARRQQPDASSIVTAGHGAAPAPPSAEHIPTERAVCVAVGPPLKCTLTDLSQCPPGATCYPWSSAGPCGGAIYCCDLSPKCDAGAIQLAQACPAGETCYTRTQCGETITCMRFHADAGAGHEDAGR